MIVGPVGCQETISGRQRALMRWYRVHGRHHLPWRHDITPYGVLVSEVMLQQTQVDRVIPYWTTWMKRWPTMIALARAKRSDVIRAWAGLGYNRRAVYLHLLAQAITQEGWPMVCAQFSQEGSPPPKHTAVERGGGLAMQSVALRACAAALQRLPGIGPYTANALLAFAWNLPAPCVDTNVRRVLAYAIYRRPAIMRMSLPHVMRLAARVIPKEKGRDWNYALMDYGALVLTARSLPRWPTPGVDHPRRKTEKFEGSTRFWRGRIVAVLRENLRPVTIHQLRRALRRHGDPPRTLTPLLRALVGDGVIMRRGRSYALA